MNSGYETRNIPLYAELSWTLRILTPHTVPSLCAPRLQDNENPVIVTLPGYLLYSTIAEPEYFLFWVFAIGSMVLYVVIFTHLFCGNRATEGFVSRTHIT